MKTQVLTDNGLSIYDEEIKQYINNVMTENKKDVIQISDDNNFEELDGGE